MTNQIKETKRLRKAKEITGAMLWIPSTCLDEVKAILEADTIRRKALKADKLLEQKRAIEAEIAKLDSTKPKSAPSQPEPDCIEAIEVQAPVQSDNATDATHEVDTVPDDPTATDAIYLVDTAETAATGFKQVSLIEPATMPASSNYDGKTSLDAALARLYEIEYDTKNKTLISKITTFKNQAKRALGIVAQGKGNLSDADKVAIYQWHVGKAGKSD